MQSASWPGWIPEEVEENLETLEHKLSPGDIGELEATRAVMRAWLAEPVSAMVADSMNLTQREPT